MTRISPEKPAKKGIDENVVRAISADKNEPEWMLEKRSAKAIKAISSNRPMPQLGCRSDRISTPDDFKYYVKPIDKQATSLGGIA